MSDIATVTQISLAIIQYSVAAALVGAAVQIPLRTSASVSAKGRGRP
jgi:hypothetical protein